MTRGLSKEQLALIALYGVSLLVTLIAVLLQLWVFAAVAAIVSFGLFSALVILTLAAMTHVASGIRGRLTDLEASVRPARTTAMFRRIDERTIQINRTLDATEARLRASEARTLAGFEDHRHHLEDEIARLRAESAGEDRAHR
ncbi:hypothetical protein [Nesterenkonia halotolerans]|uniref:Uncharacterized protein n=1 Tax=Nesterenkonia halotolerans TaxID=225325 RepID=A0ABR9J9V9_9MICC|nr:hypothetical protein [Nesterenkonia halotolerans]MBE1515776.1 hypothetical protein [Nesterenkonia halotolerans]